MRAFERNCDKSRRDNSLLKYYENPPRCKECNSVIKVGEFERISQARKKKFCNRSCSARFNGRKKKKRSSKCLYCEKDFHANYSSKGKFCSVICNGKFTKRQNTTKWLSSGRANPSSRKDHYVREYISKEQGGACKLCGICNWNKKEINFILDHVDGDSSNNNRDNLRLICPNCDSQLPTYKGRNKGKGRFQRSKRYKEGRSY